MLTFSVIFHLFHLFEGDFTWILKYFSLITPTLNQLGKGDVSLPKAQSGVGDLMLPHLK